MPPAVEQTMVGENPAGGDQILDQLRIGRSGRVRCGLRAGDTENACGGQRKQDSPSAAARLQPADHDKLQCGRGCLRAPVRYPNRDSRASSRAGNSGGTIDHSYAGDARWAGTAFETATSALRWA